MTKRINNERKTCKAKLHIVQKHSGSYIGFIYQNFSEYCFVFCSLWYKRKGTFRREGV